MTVDHNFFFLSRNTFTSLCLHDKKKGSAVLPLINVPFGIYSVQSRTFFLSRISFVSHSGSVSVAPSRLRKQENNYYFITEFLHRRDILFV